MDGYEKHATIEFIKQVSGQHNTLTINRVYLDLLEGDVKTALFLSQVIYWSDKGSRNDGWFYKTDKEWLEEICLSDYECKKARDKLTELGVLEVDKKKANGVPKMHYRMEWENLSKWVLKKFRNRQDMATSHFSVTEEFGEPSPKNSETHSGKIPKSLTYTTNIDYDNEYKRDIKEEKNAPPKANSLFDIPVSSSSSLSPLKVLEKLKGKAKLERKLKYISEGVLNPSILDDLDICFHYANQHKSIIGYEIPYQKENYMRQFKDKYNLTPEQAYNIIPSILSSFKEICEQEKRKKSEWHLKIGILTFDAPSDIARIMNKLQPKVNDKYTQDKEIDVPVSPGNVVDEVF